MHFFSVKMIPKCGTNIRLIRYICVYMYMFFLGSGDFNGDGKDDLVIADTGTAVYVLFLNQDDGLVGSHQQILLGLSTPGSFVWTDLPSSAIGVCIYLL